MRPSDPEEVQARGERVTREPPYGPGTGDEFKDGLSPADYDELMIERREVDD